jgi:predicted transcriptional regulator of viral defense system
MHKTVTRPDFDKLIKYINRGDGFFTSKHARAAGYSVQNQFYHVTQGQWERQGAGIFRYKYYPQLPNQRPDLVVSTLWSCDRIGKPVGIISHDTALSVHKLSTWSGYGVHMTVPKGFRRRSQCIYKVRLHYGDLDESDIEDYGSFRITTPLRTIIDLLLCTHIESIHIADAINDALQRKLITLSMLKKANLTPHERKLLTDLLWKVNYAKANEI